MKPLISVELEVNWYRPKSADGLWVWGAQKDVRIDSAWSKRNVIYRWVRASDSSIAMIGETERQLTERIDNYLHATRSGGAGSTNKRLSEEARRLQSQGDYLFMEVATEVLGYNLADTRERRFSEALLTGVSRPYLK